MRETCLQADSLPYKRQQDAYASYVDELLAERLDSSRTVS
jgi:hypothetical protein